MRKTILLSFWACAAPLFAQWAPQGDQLMTEWGSQLDVNHILPEYPRPLMERVDWKNLNGLWEYAIKPFGEAEPTHFEGEILVPFPLESSLSGVMKRLGADQELWYKQSFTLPRSWKNKQILLHFGAVDWKADVYLNDVKIGSHTGGYTPFYFDITPYLTSGSQKLVVKVFDGTEQGYQPRGKQLSNPHGIWYTPVSGIWQTVWLEPVNYKHIAHLKSQPDIDRQRLHLQVATENTTAGDLVEVIVREGTEIVGKEVAAIGQPIELSILNAKLWSPDSPFLYDLEVNLYEKAKLVDQVKSYAAMRKISRKADAEGIVRLQLNNEDLFHFGPLDQGWWLDGLYTAPSDAALLYDIQKTKDFGFNMIRKHVKVEPARWYAHCDRLGILVWQDMPNGGPSPQWHARDYFNGVEATRSAQSESCFRKEWREIIDYLYSYPCIAVWVPFNEAWGQFKTVEIAEWTQAYDPSRLVNPASGGNHYLTGDMIDLHNYPGPSLYLSDPTRATVLGEYGGIGLPVEGHLWQTDRNWGYIEFKNSKAVTDQYEKYADELKGYIQKCFAAAVYTQTTDVEGEVNGLITYDRKVIKLEEDRLRKINQAIIHSLKRP